MSACPLVDCHTHTSFSDGHASFEENVRAAAAAGCRIMVSTDHLIVWLLRMLASLPRRLRRSSALSMALNAIGTKVASLWLSAGPRVP